MKCPPSQPTLLCLALTLLCACSGGEPADAGPAADAGAGSEEGSPPPASEAPAPAALVNGVPIPRAEYEAALRLLLESGGTPRDLPEAQILETRRSVLDNLIARELLYQKIAKEGALPPKEETDEAVARIRAPFDSPEAWRDHLRSEGLDEASITGAIARTFAVERYLKREIVDRIEITDAEVKEYYSEHPDEMQRDGRLVPLEEVSENLRTFLRQRRARQEVEALVESLRASAEIVIDRPEPLDGGAAQDAGEPD